MSPSSLFTFQIGRTSIYTIVLSIVAGIGLSLPWDRASAILSSSSSHVDGGPILASSRQRRSDPLLVQSLPLDDKMRRFIEDEHNFYRRKVKATDMRYVYWDSDLALSAQRHADNCDFRHSNGRVNTGENIWAAPYADYREAVRLWYQEVNTCQCSNYYTRCCGHYTQVVWSQTYKVGCGAARCSDIWGVRGYGHRYVLVCHYNPGGNKIVVSNGRYNPLAAFTWQTEYMGACSQCPDKANRCNQGLCY